MAVSLDALMKHLDGIENFEKDRWYRFHGKGGLEDFRQTGTIRANPTGKYRSTYFSQGAPNARYSVRGMGSLVEAHPSTVEKIPDSRDYGTTKELIRGKDRFRLSELYDDPITGSSKYRPVYDNLSPHKYYGRKLLRGSVSPLTLALEALIYSGDVGAGSDIVEPEDPARIYLRNRLNDEN